MTKKEFETTKEPLMMIVSFNPITGKSIWDYYDYDGTDFWLNRIKKDFPDSHTSMLRNPAATKARLKSHGFPNTMNNKQEDADKLAAELKVTKIALTYASERGIQMLEEIKQLTLKSNAGGRDEG